MARSVLFFSYEDNNEDELWYDYAGKFYEVTPGLESTQGGIYPAYLDSYNDELIFQGANANDVRGMWVSNGTKAGTHEVTGIKNANPGGLDPSLFKTYNDMVLFDGASGYLGSPVYGLWVTKGTAGSTSELGAAGNREIKNANTTIGLLAYTRGFTLFDGAAYFDGYDKAGNIGLWRTNGTVAGTYEIQPIAGAFKVGSPGTDIQPDYMCVVGNEMFFGGADLQDAQYGLWVTNGTAGGTVEIGGQGNKGIKNSPYRNAMNPTVGIGPADITAFGGKAMFAGTDNTIGLNGYYTDTVGLWESDGTAGGTIEIGGHGSSGIKDAQKALDGGLLGGVANPDFTVYKNEVLFLGVDNKSGPGRVELWETNGTVAGTTEIGGIGNAGIKGHPLFSSDTKVPDFTVYDGHVLFTAQSSATNQWGIWETDGTAVGTHLLKTIGYGYEPVTDFTLAKIP